MENVCYEIYVKRKLVGHCTYNYEIEERGDIPKEICSDFSSEEIKKSLINLVLEKSKKTEKDSCLVLKIE